MKLLQTLSSILFFILCLAASALIFLPFPPRMPQSGLDESWIFALNAGVEQGLSFGKDIIFTYGPHADLYTKLYNPHNFSTVILGTSILGLVFGCCLFICFNRCRWITKILLLIYASYYLFERDSVFLFYPLLVFTAMYKLLFDNNSTFIQEYKNFVVFVLLSSFGILPLVKGTFIITCGMSLGVFVILCLQRNNYSILLYSFFSVFLFFCLFWLLSGQNISGIGSYFSAMIPIVAGYSEAMSKNGPVFHVVVYLCICLGTLYFMNKINTKNKYIISFIYMTYIFLSFKEGFVRHDGHAITAFNLIILIIFSACSYGQHSPSPAIKGAYVPCFLIALSFSCLILGIHTHTKNFSHLTPHPLHRWSALFDGIRTVCSGTSKQWEQDRQAALRKIRDEHPLPVLPGTADIYPYNQSILLATDNRWNPRPVFQSYNAYTQKLLEINKKHLLSDKGPDNIFMTVQTIDKRYPTLDDGAGWPTILDNYTLAGLDGDLAALRKTERAPDRDTMRHHGERAYKLHDAIPVSHNGFPLFARIHMRRTALGKIAAFVFKPPQVTLEVSCKNGLVHQYRLIPDMARAGFFLSPLITNTREFTQLLEKRYEDLARNEITSLIIRGNALFYNEMFTLALDEYTGDALR